MNLQIMKNTSYCCKPASQREREVQLSERGTYFIVKCPQGNKAGANCCRIFLERAANQINNDATMTINLFLILIAQVSFTHSEIEKCPTSIPQSKRKLMQSQGRGFAWKSFVSRSWTNLATSRRMKWRNNLLHAWKSCAQMASSRLMVESWQEWEVVVLLFPGLLTNVWKLVYLIIYILLGVSGSETRNGEKQSEQ